ncbi:MAG TPA: NADH-quinone oxidoreductase subunit J [Solirubrobacteraceae bacterium]
MSAVLFFIGAIGAITGAIGVVVLRNPFYSVLALAIHLVSLAALFLLLRAEFVAAAQVVVYASAVMVLYVFVVAYVGAGEQLSSGGVLRVLGPLFALALAIELCIAMLGAGLKGVNSKGAPYVSGFGTPAHLGRLFLTQYLFPFELASIVLLVAAVGAVVLARRRRGLEAEERRIDAVLFRARRSAYTGTMAEGAGMRPATQDEPYAVEAERIGSGTGDGAGANPEGGW